MRPSSAYGRGSKITAATQENFFNSKPKQQKSSNNPILVGRNILSDEQIEQQINACKQNDVELVRAQMNLKFDYNQKKSEETKKIIITGYEEQYKLINEMNEKKLETLRQEQEKFIDKLLNKQKQEIKELESSYESKIKALKQQLDDSQRELIRQQEEMMDKGSKEKNKLEQKHQKKIEELKQKQKDKFNKKIEKLKQEWLEEQDEDRDKIKKECEKKVQQELNEMRELINLMKDQINEQKAQLIEKNKVTSDLKIQLKDIQIQNEQLQKNIQQLKRSQKQSNSAKQKQLNQHSNQNINKIPLIEEKNEDDDDKTDYESIDEVMDLQEQNGNQSENEDDHHQFIQQNIQQDISVQFNIDKNNSNYNSNEEQEQEQEYMDFKQLQSDIKQSIQYQINLLHSKSQQNSNQPSQSNQLNTLGAENNPFQNTLENISLKVTKNESIRIQSKDLFQKVDNNHFLSDSDKKLDNLENISLNNSQDFVMEENDSTLGDPCKQTVQISSKSHKGTNTSFKLIEETAQKDKMLDQMKCEIEQLKLQNQTKQVEIENIRANITAEFNQKLQCYIQIIKDKETRQSNIIQSYQSEIQRLMHKIQNITDLINASELISDLPNLQMGSKNQVNNQNTQQLPQQAPPNQIRSMKSDENKSGQKKNDVKSPAFVIHQKQNNSSQKAQIIVRSSLKSVNPSEQRSTQQIQNKQNKI